MSSTTVQERLSGRPAFAAPLSLRARAASLLNRTIFCALLTLIVLTAIPYGTVEPWWKAVFECAVFVLGALWAIEGLSRGAWFVKEHRLLVPLLVVAGFTFFQTLPLPGEASREAGIDVWNAISADPSETRLVAFNLLALTLAAGLLLRYTSSRRRLRALIFTVIGVGVLSALFGILRQTTQRSAAGFVLPYLMRDSGYGQFINRNHFAFLMEMSLGLLLGLVAGRGVPHDRARIYLVVAMPIWAALILSNSRGGIFAMLSQMLFLALLWATSQTEREGATVDDVVGLGRWGRSLAFRVTLIACLFLAILIGMVWVGGDPLVARLETVKDEVGSSVTKDRSRVGRAELWLATWRMIEAHPVAGVGFGGYWTAIPAYHNASGGLVPQQAHNDYLELLASGGIVGAGLALWFLILVRKGARASLRSTDRFRRAACMGALVGLFGVAVHSLVDFGLHITVNALVLTCLVAIATIDLRDVELSP